MQILRFATLFLFALVLTPLGVVLHEAGHWTAGQAAGFPTVLHAYAVSGIPEAAPFGGNPLGVGIASLAGPAVSVLLTAFGYVIWRQDPSRLWALALAFSAPTRFLVNVFYLLGSVLVAMGIAERGNANFDEMTASRALDMPALPLVLVGAIVLPAAWALIIRGLDTSRWTSIAALAAGTGAGLALWLGPVGTFLLP